jgi:3-oxoacyl-[acyl-carrier protein] reductase
MGPRLDGKVAIVTGAGKGIGRAAARVFAREGAKVVVADIDEAPGKAAAEDLAKSGAEAIFVKTDVRKNDSCVSTVDETIKRFGRIDILYSNAGVYPGARLEEMTEDAWDQVFAINMKGTMFMVKAVLPQMRKQKYGRIVLTSSITGPNTGFPGWSHYGATKAAMLGFMRSAALEVVKDNITINAVLPGNTMTDGMQGLGQEYIQSMIDAVPMGRLADPEDIANGVLFLASDEASYVTGQTLTVDGGQVLPESNLALV